MLQSFMNYFSPSTTPQVSERERQPNNQSTPQTKKHSSNVKILFPLYITDQGHVRDIFCAEWGTFLQKSIFDVSKLCEHEMTTSDLSDKIKKLENTIAKGLSAAAKFNADQNKKSEDEDDQLNIFVCSNKKNLEDLLKTHNLIGSSKGLEIAFMVEAKISRDGIDPKFTHWRGTSAYPVNEKICLKKINKITLLENKNKSHIPLIISCNLMSIEKSILVLENELMDVRKNEKAVFDTLNPCLSTLIENVDINHVDYVVNTPETLNRIFNNFILPQFTEMSVRDDLCQLTRGWLDRKSSFSYFPKEIMHLIIQMRKELTQQAIQDQFTKLIKDRKATDSHD